MFQTDSKVPALIAAWASRTGVREYNMDSAYIFESQTGAIAAALVDGIGNDETGPEVMKHLAMTAARTVARRGVRAGVLAAAAQIDDEGAGEYLPDGVLVVAVMDPDPGETTRIGWVGDSHAYGWDGTTLRRYSTPQTMGEFLRRNGDANSAIDHDNWVTVSLSIAHVSTVAEDGIPGDQLVLLVSDGLDSVPHEELQELVAELDHDPQALADAIVNAARDNHENYRDDATAVVITRASVPHDTAARPSSAPTE